MSHHLVAIRSALTGEVVIIESLSLGAGLQDFGSFRRQPQLQ